MGWDGEGRALRVNVAGEVAEEGEADVDDYYVKVRWVSWLVIGLNDDVLGYIWAGREGLVVKLF